MTEHRPPDDDAARNPEEPSPIFDERFQVLMTGTYERGGILSILFRRRVVARIGLPPAEFSVAALLIEASHRSLSKGWAEAFRSRAQLAEDLEKRAKVGYGDPQYCAKHVNRLRKRLRTEFLKVRRRRLRLVTRAFGENPEKTLFETYAYLGYRWSVPRSAMRLRILDWPDPP